MHFRCSILYAGRELCCSTSSTMANSSESSTNRNLDLFSNTAELNPEWDEEDEGDDIDTFFDVCKRRAHFSQELRYLLCFPQCEVREGLREGLQQGLNSCLRPARSSCTITSASSHFCGSHYLSTTVCPGACCLATEMTRAPTKSSWSSCRPHHRIHSSKNGYALP